MNLWAIPFILVGVILVVKPQWGAKYLEYRGRVNIIHRQTYNKIEDKEKLRKQLKIASIVVGIVIIGMGIFVLLYT